MNANPSDRQEPDTTLDAGWLPQAIAAHARTRDLKAGEVLFRQDDAATAIFAVERGRIRMVRQTADGHVAVLHTAGVGQWFAEASLFSATYHCDAVAPVPTRVRVFPKDVLLQAIRADPHVALGFLSTLAHEIQDLRARLENRNIRSARERVTQYLRLRADVGTGSVPVNGTLMELADELGLTHEALYRTLAGLEADGVIARDKARIVVKGPPGV